MILILALLVFTDIRVAWDPPESMPEPVLYYEIMLSQEGAPYPLGWVSLLKTTNTTAEFLSYPLTNRMEITVRAVYLNRGPSRPSNRLTIDPELYEPKQLRFNYPSPSPSR